MKKLFLLLLIIVIRNPMFADSSPNPSKDKYFILPELVLFGEEQFYLLPFPLNEQASLSYNKNVQAGFNKDNNVSYVNQMKIEQYPRIYTFEIPEKIALINHFLTNPETSGFMSRKENSITLLYSPFYSLYSTLQFLSEYHLWNYSFDFTGEYNALSDIFSIVNNAQLERNSTELPLKLKLLYGSGFRMGSYINNIAESSLKLGYSYRKIDINSSITALATYSNVDVSNYFTGTAVGDLNIGQYYTNLLPVLSVMGAVWSFPNDKGYNYVFTVYPAYRINELNIGVALRISDTDYAIYPAVSYRIRMNEILSISLYTLPEFRIERGLEKYLMQNIASETCFPVSNFEKFGIKLSEKYKDKNSGSLAAEVLHGNFVDLRENNVSYTANTVLNITLDYSQTFNSRFYGELTYKFQEELGYPLPFKLFSKTPSHLLYLKAQFDFIKIPLQIIINTNILSRLLLGESLEWTAIVGNERKNEFSAWFVFKPNRYYDFGMVFRLFIDENDGALKFENSFFLKSKKIKIRS